MPKAAFLKHSNMHVGLLKQPWHVKGLEFRISTCRSERGFFELMCFLGFLLIDHRVHSNYADIYSPEVFSEFDFARMSSWCFSSWCFHVYSRLKKFFGRNSGLWFVYFGSTRHNKSGRSQRDDRSRFEAWNIVSLCGKSKFTLRLSKYHGDHSCECYFHLQSGTQCQPQRVHKEEILWRLNWIERNQSQRPEPGYTWCV